MESTGDPPNTTLQTDAVQTLLTKQRNMESQQEPSAWHFEKICLRKAWNLDLRRCRRCFFPRTGAGDMLIIIIVMKDYIYK